MSASTQATQTDSTAAAPVTAPGLGVDGLPAGQRLSLEEMSRIMDVAASLRKERALVDEQLNIDQIKAKLRERLLEVAKISGDPVTAEEIDAAVRQYYEQLHEFREPAAGFETFLAHVWVLRTSLFKWAMGIFAVFAIVQVLIGVRNARNAAITSNLYEQSVAAERAILAWDDAAPLKPELETKIAAARAAIGDFDAQNRIKAELEALRGEFEAQYEVTILSTPDERSATERVWTDEHGARISGFYVFVAARDAQGRPVAVSVHNRESDRVEQATRWGEQVPEAVFDRLAADKQADGVLDEREFGVKRRGTREFEVLLKGADGQPIPRGGQITSW